MRKEEYLEIVKEYTGENTDDKTLAFIEKMSGAYDEIAPSEDWKAKYEENDTAWRKKYKDAFFGKGTDPEEDKPPIHDPMRFKDLFTTKKERKD